MDIAIVFSIMGACFGVAFATSNFESIYWSETNWIKRLIRGVIGGSVTIGVYFLSSLIPITDSITTFTFKYAVPNLVSTLLVFGFVPVFCKYIGLVK
jgi:hypothetical protein